MGEKGNGLTDLLAADGLAASVQMALRQVQTVTDALETWRTEAKGLAKCSPEKSHSRLPEWTTNAGTCILLLQDAAVSLQCADRLAAMLQPEPKDEGDRNLLQSMLIAASGGFPSLPDALSRTTRKQRSPGRAKPTRWKDRGAG